jgi:hypothetical protein
LNLQDFQSITISLGENRGHRHGGLLAAAPRIEILHAVAE